MSGPVDVISALTISIRTLSVGGVKDEAGELHKARAAVAELIEEATEALDTLEGCASEYGEDFGQRELRAALARVQGGTA